MNASRLSRTSSGRQDPSQCLALSGRASRSGWAVPGGWRSADIRGHPRDPVLPPASDGGSVGTVCICQATSPETIREHAPRRGSPSTRSCGRRQHDGAPRPRGCHGLTSGPTASGRRDRRRAVAGFVRGQPHPRRPMCSWGRDFALRLPRHPALTTERLPSTCGWCRQSPQGTRTPELLVMSRAHRTCDFHRIRLSMSTGGTLCHASAGWTRSSGSCSWTRAFCCGPVRSAVVPGFGICAPR